MTVQMTVIKRVIKLQGCRRIELITGDTRRRRWTAQEKAEILAETFLPGASIAEVARRHGVSRGLLWSWRHQARKCGMVGEPSFVPVRIVDETAAPAGSPAVDQEGGGTATTGQSGDAMAVLVTGPIDSEIREARASAVWLTQPRDVQTGAADHLMGEAAPAVRAFLAGAGYPAGGGRTAGSYQRRVGLYERPGPA